MVSALQLVPLLWLRRMSISFTVIEFGLLLNEKNLVNNCMKFKPDRVSSRDRRRTSNRTVDLQPLSWSKPCFLTWFLKENRAIFLSNTGFLRPKRFFPQETYPVRTRRSLLFVALSTELGGSSTSGTERKSWPVNLKWPTKRDLKFYSVLKIDEIMSNIMR